MFGFTPPPTPMTTPNACPHCASHQAIALYATARTEYFRCVDCGQIWTVTHDDGEHAPVGAAA